MTIRFNRPVLGSWFKFRNSWDISSGTAPYYPIPDDIFLVTGYYSKNIKEAICRLKHNYGEIPDGVKVCLDYRGIGIKINIYSKEHRLWAKENKLFAVKYLSAKTCFVIIGETKSRLEVTL